MALPSKDRGSLGSESVPISTDAPGGATESMQDIVKQIVEEYNYKIADLSRLTADLAKRLHVDTDKADDVAPKPEERVLDEATRPSAQSFASVGATFSNCSGEWCVTSFASTVQAQMLENVSWHLKSVWHSGVQNSNSLAFARERPDGRPTIGTIKSAPMDHLSSMEQSPEEMHDFSHAEEVTGLMSHLVSSPGSVFRISWELMGMAFVLYDLIAIPLTSAFEPPPALSSDIIGWLVLIYWSLNVPVTLTTGYISNGILITNPSSICEQYFRTWFLVDAVTIVPDWFLAISGMLGVDTFTSATYLKLIRLLRLLRLARLFRLVKLRNAWITLYDLLDSEKVGILADVLKMVLVLMIVNHYVACAWFAVALSQSGSNWVEAYGLTREEVDWGHQYVVAYHWSITQFTPSSMHVQPQCVNERVFAIVTVIFALVGFSYLVGSITGSLGRLRAMSERKTQLFWLMRRFLRRSNVPKMLSLRIKSYVESVWVHQQNHMRQDSVEVLSLLSHHLRSELKLCVHSRTLNVHPLLLELQTAAASTMRRLVFSGLSQASFAPQDVVVTAGEVATHMCFLTDGILEYSRQGETMEIVESGEDWIAEPVLWIERWHYLGNLRSVRSSELSRIDAKAFASVVETNAMAHRLVIHYAANYITWLNELEKELVTDISNTSEVYQTLMSFIKVPDLDEDSPVTRAPSVRLRASIKAKKMSVVNAFRFLPHRDGMILGKNRCHRETVRPAAHRRSSFKDSEAFRAGQEASAAYDLDAVERSWQMTDSMQTLSSRWLGTTESTPAADCTPTAAFPPSGSAGSTPMEGPSSSATSATI